MTHDTERTAWQRTIVLYNARGECDGMAPTHRFLVVVFVALTKHSSMDVYIHTLEERYARFQKSKRACNGCVKIARQLASSKTKKTSLTLLSRQSLTQQNPRMC
jgi:hypothetical protein